MGADTVLIDLNKVGSNMDLLIGEALVKNKLPSCYGHAYPPIIELEHEFSIKDISMHSGEADYGVPLFSATSPNELGIIQDRVFTTDGISIIEKYKEKVAGFCADRLAQCATCDFFDRCNELTKNHVQSMQMNVINRLNKSI